MSEDEKDYEVVYGKPPKHTRFKKGKSGNPKGRPNGAKGVLANMRRELEKPVKVREGNREVTVSKAEAMAKRLVTSALKGDQKALMALLKLDPELFEGNEAGPDGAAQAAVPEAVDYDILRDFFTNGAGNDPASAETEADDDNS